MPQLLLLSLPRAATGFRQAISMRQQKLRLLWQAAVRSVRLRSAQGGAVRRLPRARRWLLAIAGDCQSRAGHTDVDREFFFSRLIFRTGGVWRRRLRLATRRR